MSSTTLETKSTTPSHFVDETVPTTNPHAESDTYTVADYEWLLSRFTAPEWTVENCEFVENRNVATIVLRATLRHTTGSLLRCVPKYSKKGLGSSIKDVHRIYLNNQLTEEPSQVLTLNTSRDDVHQPTSIVSRGVYGGEHKKRVIPWDQFTAATEHPYPILLDCLKTATKSYIHIVEDDLNALPNIVDNVPDALLTLYGGAQTVTQIYRSQSRISDFQ